MQSSFPRGGQIVIRELCQGRIWAARPCIVVQDTPQLLALWFPPNTIEKHGALPNGQRPAATDLAIGNWIMEDRVWHGPKGRIRLSIPGERYSVLLFWNTDRNLSRYYINLEKPLIRTGIGFDCVDMVLDVIVSPDLSSWHWEDEDELEEAIAANLVSHHEADEFRAVGLEVVSELMSGKSVFNEWKDWKPDRFWTIPSLPVGWDKI